RRDRSHGSDYDLISKLRLFVLSTSRREWDRRSRRRLSHCASAARWKRKNAGCRKSSLRFHPADRRSIDDHWTDLPRLLLRRKTRGPEILREAFCLSVA